MADNSNSESMEKGIGIKPVAMSIAPGDDSAPSPAPAGNNPSGQSQSPDRSDDD